MTPELKVKVLAHATAQSLSIVTPSPMLPRAARALAKSGIVPIRAGLPRAVAGRSDQER